MKYKANDIISMRFASEDKYLIIQSEKKFYYVVLLNGSQRFKYSTYKLKSDIIDSTGWKKIEI